MKRSLLVVSAIFMSFFMVHSARGEDRSRSVTPETAFTMLKQLAGDWTEYSPAAEGQPETKVSYRITARGTVLMETEFPGTDHEMVSMYHMNGDQLMLTHYCAMGNQPKMVLEKGSSPRELVFSFAGGTNIIPEKDAHIHSGKIQIINDNVIRSEWAVYKDGDKIDVNTFHLTRVE